MAPKDSDKALAKTAKGGVEKAAKKPVKKAKDPNAPKRPMSAYFFFSNEVREKVKADNPGIAFGEVGKKIGEMWAKLSADDKGPYEKKAEADKARYEKEKASYQKA